jgi:hypothetical protein
MAALLYAARADLHAFGLPRGAIPNPGRLLAAASSSTNTLTLDVHGFEEDDALSFRAEAGGTLPAPLVAGTTYYAEPVSEYEFRVRATAGGAAIDLSSAGDAERTIVIAPLPVERWISWASRLIDEMVPAHLVPFGPTLADVPEIVRMTCAELAAGKGLGFGGASSKSLTAMVKDARSLLTQWAKGIPVRGDRDKTTPANLAASAVVPYADPRGWNRHGGIG